MSQIRTPSEPAYATTDGAIVLLLLTLNLSCLGSVYELPGFLNLRLVAIEILLVALLYIFVGMRTGAVIVSIYGRVFIFVLKCHRVFPAE
jgi:type III secretory pathway component EscR